MLSQPEVMSEAVSNYIREDRGRGSGNVAEGMTKTEA